MPELPEKLLVNIEVTQRKIEAQLAKIAKQAGSSAEGIEKRFNAANKNVAKSFGSSSFAAGNLAAQLNDIGVSLAAGQSPFTVMIQQGSQVSQVLNQAGGSAQALKAVMVGAFSQMLNPISLATFAVIGLSGVAVQFFSSMGDEAKSSEDVLKEFNAIVDEIGKTSKASAEEIKAMLNTPESWAALRADAQQVSKDIEKGLVEKIREATDRMHAFITPWDELSPAVLEAQQHIRDLADDLESGRKTSEEVYQELSNMATAETYPPSLMDTITSLRTIIKTARVAQAQLSALSLKTSRPAGPAMAEDMAARFGDVADKQERMGSEVKDKLVEQLQQQADKIANSVKNTTMPGGGSIPTPGDKPSLLDYDPSGSHHGRKGGGGSTNSYQSGIRTIQDRTAALEAENAALSQVNPLENDYDAAVTKARISAQLLNDAQKAGLAITPQLKATIDAVAQGYTNASVEAQKLAENQRQAQQTAQEFAALGKDVMGGFIRDLQQGKSASEALAGALQKVTDKLLDVALNSIFDSKGGGGLGAIFGSIGKIFGFADGGVMTPSGPRRLKTFASGGVSNKAAIFGEAGPEAAVPLPDGRRIPVDLRGAAKGQSSQPVSINVNVEGANGDQHVISLVRQGVSQGLSTYDKQLTGTFGSRMSRAQQRQI